MTIRCSVLLIAASLLCAGAVSARGGNGPEIQGFLMGHFAGRTTGRSPDAEGETDFLLAEERLRLELEAWSESVEAAMRIKGDVFHDAVEGEFDIDLREAYLDYAVGDFDFRLGRQIATWGVGDLLFINDIFPKDWVSFFAGRPLEHLKVGVDGLRTRHSTGIINAELFLVPVFQPDNVPTSERFLFADPFASVAKREEHEPDSTYENTEVAARVYRRVGAFDVSLYGYRGFWRTPSMMPDDMGDPTLVTSFYPALSIYGCSAEGGALSGIVSLEVGYYDSRDDRGGDEPSIPNSQGRFLVGYQRQPWQDFTVGVQYYGELMRNHSAYVDSLPPGDSRQDEYRDTVTLRLDRLLKHQTWRVSLFTFYGIADQDYLVQPQISCKVSDNLATTLGANVFGGKRDWTAFGQFADNDNVYVTVRFDY